MKILTLVLFISTLTYADKSYKDKVCDDLAYMILISKATSKTKEKSNLLIYSKYANFPRSLEIQMKKDKALSDLNYKLPDVMCDEKSTVQDVNNFIKERFYFINLIKKACAKNLAPSNEYMPLDLVSKNISQTGNCKNWQQCFDDNMKYITQYHSAGYDPTKPLPRFKSQKILYRIKDRKQQCKELVIESNIFLTWLRS